MKVEKRKKKKTVVYRGTVLPLELAERISAIAKRDRVTFSWAMRKMLEYAVLEFEI